MGSKSMFLMLTLPPTFTQRERASGLEFCRSGRVGHGGWRVALRVAQRQAPLQGEGLGELGRGWPAEAGVWAFGVVVRAPSGQHGAGTARGFRSRAHRADDLLNAYRCFLSHSTPRRLLRLWRVHP